MADYYTAATDPANNSDLDSSVIRAEWAAIAAAFVKIAQYTSNGGKAVFINAGGTAMEAVTATGSGNAVRATAPTLTGTVTVGTLVTSSGVDPISMTLNATPGAYARFQKAGVDFGFVGIANELTVTGGDNLAIRSTGNIQLAAGSDAVTVTLSSSTATFGTSLSTLGPDGAAGPAWKLGVADTVSPTSPNRTIRVDIGGTSYYLHAKTTNN